MSCAPLAAIASAMPATLWLRRLSSRTIVKQDDVARCQCGRQHLLDIGAKALAVDRAFEYIGHTDPGRPQSGNQGGQLPVTVRDRRPQPQTARASAIAPRHVRGSPGLVDKDQAVGIERRLTTDEHPPGLGDIRAVLLGRMEGLFLSVSLWAARNRCTVLSPTVIPHAAASALRISCRVKSGCWATSCSTLARCWLNRERRSPPITRGRAWPSARQRCAQRRALLTLISNRVAAARALPPSAMKPITRSLRSCEYGAGISPPMHAPAAASPISKGLKTPLFLCLPDRKPL